MSRNRVVPNVIFVILLSSPHLSLHLFLLSRLAGRRKKSERRESLPEGKVNSEDDEDADRRPSFLRSLGKLRGDSFNSRDSQEAEQESPEEETPIKHREPLSGENLYPCWCFVPSLLLSTQLLTLFLTRYDIQWAGLLMGEFFSNPFSLSVISMMYLRKLLIWTKHQRCKTTISMG